MHFSIKQPIKIPQFLTRFIKMRNV